MADSCIAQGCRYSPKYACMCDSNLNFCETHLSEHLIIGESHKPILNLAESKKIEQKTKQEMAHLFTVSSKTLIAGKQMFKEICNKLCKITDELASRQQTLIELGTQSKFDVNTEESIKKLSQIGLKFRSTEDFQKLIEKHFSESDDCMDLSLFSVKFDEITEKLALNNGFLQLVADKSARGRQELNTKIQKITQENSEKQTIFEKKINEISDFIKEFAKNDQVMNLKDRTAKLESEVEQLKTKTDQHASGIEISKNGINKQAKKIETQSKTLIEYCRRSLRELSDNQVTLEKILKEQVNKCEVINKKLDNNTIENSRKLQGKFDEFNSILNENIESVKKIQNELDLKLNNNNEKIMEQRSTLSKKIEEVQTELKVGYEQKYNQIFNNLEKRINEFHTGSTIQFNNLNKIYGELTKDVTKLNYKMKIIEPVVEEETKKLEERQRKKTEEERKKKEEERKQIEDERKKMEVRQRMSIIYTVDFNALPLKKKQEKVQSMNLVYFSIYNECQKDILFTYDEKYIFLCIL